MHRNQKHRRGEQRSRWENVWLSIRKHLAFVWESSGGPLSATGLIVLLAIALALLMYFAYLTWALTQSAISSGWSPEKDLTRAQAFDFAGKAALGAGGVLAFAVAAWRGYSHDQQVRLAQKQRLDERFSDAVKLLGDDMASTRIGGLLALERLLHDDQFRSEQWIIVQLLESYVRETCAQTAREKPRKDARQGDSTFAPQGSASIFQGADATKEGTASTNQISPMPESPIVEASPQMPSEGQIAMAILGRRPTVSEPRALDFSRLNLNNLRGSGAKFEGADFSNSCIGNADFTRAKLSECKFAESELAKTKFDYAELAKADFWNASLEGSHFHETILCDADFSNAKMTGCSFIAAQIDQAVFSYGHLVRSDFWGATGEAVDFSYCDLRLAEFANVRLSGADFTDALLLEANFSGAVLRSAKFGGANLEGAELGRSRVNGEKWPAARIQDARGLTYDQARLAKNLPRGLLRSLRQEVSDSSDNLDKS